MQHETFAQFDLPPAGAADIAEYIGEMTQELALVAQRAGLPVLAYLLELANGEAQAMMLLERDRQAA